MRQHLADESATLALGAALARALEDDGEAAVILLEGPLGAGKTSLARALLRTLGETGPVRSPTYTLMEPYELAGRVLYHLDLYRLSDPEELEYLGLRDLEDPGRILLVEWPERGQGLLPAGDLRIRLAHAETGREARLAALSPRGERLLTALAPDGKL